MKNFISILIICSKILETFSTRKDDATGSSHTDKDKRTRDDYSAQNPLNPNAFPPELVENRFAHLLRESMLISEDGSSKGVAQTVGNVPHPSMVQQQMMQQHSPVEWTTVGNLITAEEAIGEVNHASQSKKQKIQPDSGSRHHFDDQFQHEPQNDYHIPPSMQFQGEQSNFPSIHHLLHTQSMDNPTGKNVDKGKNPVQLTEPILSTNPHDLDKLKRPERNNILLKAIRGNKDYILNSLKVKIKDNNCKIETKGSSMNEEILRATRNCIFNMEGQLVELMRGLKMHQPIGLFEHIRKNFEKHRNVSKYPNPLGLKFDSEGKLVKSEVQIIEDNSKRNLKYEERRRVKLNPSSELHSTIPKFLLKLMRFANNDVIFVALIYLEILETLKKDPHDDKLATYLSTIILKNFEE